jgi:predicted deacylase
VKYVIHDISSELLKSFSALAPRANMTKVILSDSKGQEIYSYKSNSNPKCKLLISSGFHGDEPGGVLALLRALQLLPITTLQSVSLTIIPIVNIDGLNRLQRRNEINEDPNRGFSHNSTTGDLPSKEGRVLLNNFDFILDSARDGFMTIHEDIDEKRFYMYNSQINDMTIKLRTIGMKCFPLVSNGDVYGDKISGGIVYGRCDGSFEDKLKHEGVKFTTCIELPGKCSLEQRITCGVALIKTFIDTSVLKSLE